jgi:hypothetical protein
MPADLLFGAHKRQSLELKDVKNNTHRRHVSGKQCLTHRTLFDSHPLRTRTVGQMGMTACTPLGGSKLTGKYDWYILRQWKVGVVFCSVQRHDRVMLDRSHRCPR